jgi:hypothetical protein
MFPIEGIKKVEKIKWREIQSGMIFLGGIIINDTVPFELRGFPVLTSELVEELKQQYRFCYDRDILIAHLLPGFSPIKISRELNRAQELIYKLNTIRSAFFSEKSRVLEKVLLPPSSLEVPLIDTGCVEQSCSITNRYNSFTIPFSIDLSPVIPSFFKRPDVTISMGHLLSRRTGLPFNLPEDRKVLLHCVVDYSPGMKKKERWDAVTASLYFLNTHMKVLLKGTEIKLYVFSEECRPVSYPLTGREIPRNKRCFSSFIKKVLHHKDTEGYNKVLVFTDGLPDDRSETLHYIRLFKKNKLDYTQILLGWKGEKQDTQRTGQLHDFTVLADAGGGNQLIITNTDCTAILAEELYDRYLGLLTLVNSRAKTQDIQEPQLKTKSKHTAPSYKKITKWQPRVIKKKK